MANYPKPDGWRGGRDGGHFLLQGSAGHLGVNPQLGPDDFSGDARRNANDIGGFEICNGPDDGHPTSTDPYYDGDE